MKKCLLLFSVLLVTLAVNAQTDFKEEVVETTLTKEVMWNNLKKWVSSSFNSSKHVVDLEDKENGVLVVKYTTNIPCFVQVIELTGESTMQIDVRDNKYRIRLSEQNVVIKPNIRNSSDMSVSDLNQAISDLEFIEEKFNATKINVADIEPIWKQQLEKLDATLKYKNEKNEKKGKVTKEYEQEDRKARILQNMYNGYNLLNGKVVESLKNQMNYVDDF